MCRTILTVYDRRLLSRYHVGWIVALLLLFGIARVVPTAYADIRVPPLNERLQSLGYPCDTLGQIETALGATDHTVRRLAVLLLAERYAERSVPRIAESLRDEHLQVRIAAARALRKHGDKSGLQPMRVAWERLSSPPVGKGEDALFQEANAAQLADVMDVALALAEFGDNRGYRLAELTALKGPLEAQRYRAIWVLTEIARTSRGKVGQDGLNPGVVLQKMAGSEKSELVQKQLLAAMSRFRKELDPVVAVRVIEALAASPYASEELRNRARELARPPAESPVKESTGRD